MNEETGVKILKRLEAVEFQNKTLKIALDFLLDEKRMTLCEATQLYEGRRLRKIIKDSFSGRGIRE